MPGISTHEQRLAWQYDEQTAGIYRDPDPAELLEEQDAAARHYDFEPDVPAPPDGTFSGHPRQTEASSAGAHPLTRPAKEAAGGEIRASTVPSEGSGLATSSRNWELHAWQPDPTP